MGDHTVIQTVLKYLSTYMCDSGHNGQHQRLHNTPRSDPVNEYEYVVVGSGPGGAPLAARLAIAGHKVLLIDAGADHGHAIRQMVPALQLQSTEYEPMRWDYFVHHYSNLTRQEEDSKMTYRTPTGDFHVGPNPPANSEPLGILYPRAGTLGGCSAHNAMMLVKAIPFCLGCEITYSFPIKHHLPV